MKKILAGVVLASAILSSCLGGATSQLYTITQLSAIRQGDSPQKVNLIIDKKPIIEGVYGNNKYQVRDRLTTEINENLSFAFDLFYFENDALKYWGSFDDFKVHDNPEYRKVAEKALKELWELKK